MSEHDVIDSSKGVLMMIPVEPSPTDTSVTLTSSTAIHGADSRTLAIALAVIAVVALAIGAMVMSNTTGARAASKSQSTSTTTTPAGPVTPDDLFVAAVRPLVPGESEATLISTGRAFCQTVAADQGDTHAAALEAVADNTSATIVDSDLVQIEGAAVSAYCPQYNIDALNFN